jgi:hypothetical protein
LPNKNSLFYACVVYIRMYTLETPAAASESVQATPEEVVEQVPEEEEAGRGLQEAEAEAEAEADTRAVIETVKITLDEANLGTLCYLLCLLWHLHSYSYVVCLSVSACSCLPVCLPAVDLDIHEGESAEDAVQAFCAVHLPG